MQKTVREIIEMIDSGILHYDQSTQRNFIYFTINQNTDDGDLTKAGNVIRSILQFDIQLPALYFWDIGNGQYNIHDGKQRILSIYYFYKPTSKINVVTRINGREVTFKGLLPEQQEKLLNYTFDIVVKKGTPEQEENSFYMINTNSVPLTDYESLRGMFHGTWIYEFEQFLDSKSKVIDNIKRIGRGEQAIQFLYNCFGLLGDKSAINKIRLYLRSVRNNSFNPDEFKLNEIIDTYSEFIKITSVSSEKALQVASFITSKDWDKDFILDYYRKIMRKANDVKSWKIETHKTAISKLIQDDIECDGLRLFSDNDKSELYKRSQRCAEANCQVTNYKELEVDHIDPWSKGGRTILGNARLLCKSHNASKGNDEDGIKG